MKRPASLPSSAPKMSAAIAQALKLHEAGRVTEAIAAYRNILRLKPRDFDALHLLGVALSQSGASDEGVKAIREALRVNPNSLSARNNLGHALVKQGAHQEALPLFQALVARNPQHEKALQGLSQCLLGLSRPAEALRVVSEAIMRFPGSSALLNEIGKAQAALGKHSEAANSFGLALKVDPTSAVAATNLAASYIELRRYDDAEKILGDLLKDDPENMGAKSKQIVVHRMRMQSGKALELAREALARHPEDKEIRSLLGLTLVDLGQNAEAEDVLRESIRRNESVASALSGLVQIHKFKADDPEIDLVNRLLESSMLGTIDRKSLLFTKAKIEDDIGHAGAAVEAAIAAKAINPLPDNFASHQKHVRQLIGRMDSAFFAERRALGNTTEQPVFILGMPRSGTTLTEQIIASHPRADGAGELTALPDIARKLGYDADTGAFLTRLSTLGTTEIQELAESYLAALQRDRKAGVIRITDKLPHNFQSIWLIALLFPNARIIHCNRNAVDVCISIFLRNFGQGHWYTRDLETLGKFYNLYKEQVAHWKAVTGLKWYENDYEQLVADPEPNIRRMIDFLGLPWDDKCLQHSQTERAVMTFSKWQVRQPIYKSSVERWKKYAPYIGPLLKELGIPAP